MASSRCMWTALVLFWTMTGATGVFGRAVDTRGFLSQSFKTAREPSGSTLRTDALRRWRRGVTDAHRERCAELAAPWQENTERGPEDNETLLQLRVRPFSPGASPGLVFPGKHLFSFVRRVYRCCQEGLSCRSVKGIQGRLRGDTDVEFLLSSDILSLAVRRAELHLQLSNPHHLDIHPVLTSLAKRGFPTRYSLWSRGNTVELRLDLLFLFQEVAMVGGAGRGPSLVNIRQVAVKTISGALQDADSGGALELGVVLGCSQAGSAVPCTGGGVHLSHTPFLALYYR